MKSFTQNRAYSGVVKGVVLDWAGTAVDYGCIGPVAVFAEVFKKYGVDVTIDEARRFMGLMKRDHIRSMFSLTSVNEKWITAHGRKPDENDVDAIFQDTEPMMVSSVASHSDPVPGLIDTIAKLREKKIKIGSSTGYTGPIMEVLAAEAARKGYMPDSIVCSTDVPSGRPYPWMCYMNAMNLNLYPISSMVKIGDTVADIEEGVNAGMWVVGLTKSGNELGLTEKEVSMLDSSELEKALNRIEERFVAAGAHYVAEGIWECIEIIEDINNRLSCGENPISELHNLRQPF